MTIYFWRNVLTPEVPDTQLGIYVAASSEQEAREIVRVEGELTIPADMQAEVRETDHRLPAILVVEERPETRTILLRKRDTNDDD